MLRAKQFPTTKRKTKVCGLRGLSVRASRAPPRRTAPPRPGVLQRDKSALLDILRLKFNTPDPSNLYRLTSTDLKTLSKDTGRHLLKQYHTILQMAETLWPDTEWLPWQFPTLPRGWWESAAHQKRYLSWLGKAQGIPEGDLSGWYNVQVQHYLKNHGRSLLTLYHYRLSDILKFHYPDEKWLLWLFKGGVPNHFWESKENRLEYMAWLAEIKEFKQYAHLYGISLALFKMHEGTGFIEHYGNSPLGCLVELYPCFKWKAYQLSTTSKSFWSNVENQVDYLDGIGISGRFVGFSDYYSINIYSFQSAKGFHEMYRCSSFKILSSLYMQCFWRPWCFGQAEKGVWDSSQSVSQYFDYFSQSFAEITQYSDWYQFTIQDYTNYNGGGLLHKNQGSTLHTLQLAYPSYFWEPWLFKNSSSRKFWKNSMYMSTLVQKLEDKLQIYDPSEWGRVSQKQLSSHRMHWAMQKYGGLSTVLKEYHPQHDWNETFTSHKQPKKAEQRALLLVVKGLFPDEEVVEDYKHPLLIYKSTNRKMELDIFLPNRSLAFEYHGQQHYQEINFFHNRKPNQLEVEDEMEVVDKEMVAEEGVEREGKEVESGIHLRKRMDSEKLEACQRAGITLITVPYYWEGTKDALSLLIQLQTNANQQPQTTQPFPNQIPLKQPPP